MDFKSFKLVQTDMTAQRRVYEGYKTENGVHLEYYISTEMWDDKTSENVIVCVRERLAAASFFPKGTEWDSVPFGK